MLRPAIRVIDELIAARMHRGKRQGDPLGTAFCSNTRQRYRIYLGKSLKGFHRNENVDGLSLELGMSRVESCTFRDVTHVWKGDSCILEDLAMRMLALVGRSGL